MKLANSYEEQLSLQVEQRRTTVELIKVISDLWYENNIELFLFRNQLIDRNVSGILNLLDYAKEFVQKPISMEYMLKIAQKIQGMNLPPAKIDLGKLAYVFHLTGAKDIDEFVADKLGGARNGNGIKPKDVVLYGFGRIGRLLTRELMSRTGSGVQMRLRAIVTRGE
ncbi:MAG: glyceraldehyde-3-phosphate dehydrogenase, partial [Lutimonas sp.]